MSMNDGGPAFPTVAGQTVYSNGMSLRDYFAGQALVGICSNPNHRLGQVTYNQVGEDAYKFADAILAAREAK